jgi:GSCFA family
VIALTLLTWIFCTVNSLSHSTVESGGMVKLGRLSQLKQHRFLLGNKVQMMSSNAEPFTTRVNIPPVNWKIDHRTPIHLVGSCFTDTISSALKKEKFDCFSNGQGIMFNPISISGCLKNVLNSRLHKNVLNCSTDKIVDPLNTFSLPYHDARKSFHRKRFSSGLHK